MRRLSTSLTASLTGLIAAGLLSSAAFAASMSASGAIKSIDAKAHTLTLDNGEVFHLPKKMKTSKLKTGEKVNVTYESAHGKMMAKKVVAEKPAKVHTAKAHTAKAQTAKK